MEQIKILNLWCSPKCIHSNSSLFSLVSASCSCLPNIPLVAACPYVAIYLHLQSLCHQTQTLQIDSVPLPSPPLPSPSLGRSVVDLYLSTHRPPSSSSGLDWTGLCTTALPLNPISYRDHLNSNVSDLLCSALLWDRPKEAISHYWQLFVAINNWTGHITPQSLHPPAGARVSPAEMGRILPGGGEGGHREVQEIEW